MACLMDTSPGRSFMVVPLCIYLCVAGCTGDEESPDVDVDIILNAETDVELHFVENVVEDMEPSTTFEGTVTNIVTGLPVGGATLSIGVESTTTSNDGVYSLTTTASGTLDFSVGAPGYHTRESAISMAGSTSLDLEIIPDGDGFSLEFYDHVFRDGDRGTRRWVTEPTVDIWAQQLSCVEPCGSAGYEVTAEPAPEHFEAYAREAIAQMSDLTGGAMTEPVITVKTLEVGAQVSPYESGDNIRFKYLKTFAPPYEMDGGATSGHPDSQNAWVDAPISINGSSSPSSSSNAIYVHEFAHAMGWIPGHPQGVPAVPQPSIMGPNPVVVTAADRLHGKILYRRPPGSLSPDRDPPGTVINAQ